MGYWEFLLQKEGDRSWLPLDSPNVEILAGRYRIVVRSDRPNTDVGIRISHLTFEEVPPKRRIQRRSGRTNAEGLMVVIPFTALETGSWEFECSSTDMMSELMGESWQYAVQLQVLSTELDAATDWDLEWTPSEAEQPPPPATPSGNEAPTLSAPVTSVPLSSPGIVGPTEFLAATPTEPPSPLNVAESTLTNRAEELTDATPLQTIGTSKEYLLQLTDQLSEQLVNEILQEFNFDDDFESLSESSSALSELSTIAPAMPAIAPILTSQCTETTPEQEFPPREFIYLLTLSQEAFVIRRSDELQISGTVVIAEVESASGVSDGQPWDGPYVTNGVVQELQLCLRDPQSMQILVSDRQPCSETPPFTFTFTCKLPDNTLTHLVLGEVLLCGSVPHQPYSPLVLSTQAFSVTVDPGGLVKELEKLTDVLNAEPESEAMQLPLDLSRSSGSDSTASLNLSFLDDLTDSQTPKPPTGTAFLAGDPLPPQLYRSDSVEGRSRSLELPSFSIPQSPPQTTESSELPHPIESEEIEEISQSSNDSIADPMTTAHLDSENVEQADNPEQLEIDPLSVAWEESAETSDASAEMTAPEPAENEPASLEETGSSVQSAFHSLKLQDRFISRLTSLAQEGQSPEEAFTPVSLSPNVPAPSPASVSERLDHEIVVDDEPTAPQNQRRPPTQSSQSQTPDQLPDDVAVPIPDLQVIAEELVAGQSINIRIRLPDLSPRIYVKLWLTDRQTRSLLDGPRWLVDFLPNGRGTLEAFTQITVPLGCLEVRFEAIAVEVQTQRESHKATVDRSVVPPDLPTLSMDDL